MYFLFLQKTRNIAITVVFKNNCNKQTNSDDSSLAY